MRKLYLFVGAIFIVGLMASSQADARSGYKQGSTKIPAHGRAKLPMQARKSGKINSQTFAEDRKNHKVKTYIKVRPVTKQKYFDKRADAERAKKFGLGKGAHLADKPGRGRPMTSERAGKELGLKGKDGSGYNPRWKADVTTPPKAQYRRNKIAGGGVGRKETTLPNQRIPPQNIGKIERVSPAH